MRDRASMRSLLGLSALVLGCANSERGNGRYLYELDCSTTLARFDTLTGQKTDLTPGAMPSDVCTHDEVTSEELGAYGPHHRDLANRILERSGARLLLQLLEGEELSIAVADTSLQRLVQLPSPLHTTVDRVHLSPGGGHVLVEEVVGEDAVKSGQLTLFDAASGQPMKTYRDRATVELDLRAITPNGKAFYERQESYRFVDLGMTFPNVQVVKPRADDVPPPRAYFADR